MRGRKDVAGETCFSRSRVIESLLTTVVVFAGCALLCSDASADPEIAAEPALFGAAGKDSLWLKSGERLIGEILLYRDDEMAFDSDELDEHAIEFDDIRGFRSPRVLTLTFKGNLTLTGTAVMVDDVVRVRTIDGVVEHPAISLLSAIEGKPNELNLWGVRASLGLSATSGNTQQSDLSTMIRLRREATRSRIDINYSSNFGKVDSVETINNQSWSVGGYYYIRRGFFVTPLGIDVYRNRFQNLDYRYTLGSGVGYFIIRSSKRDLFVQLGAGYRVTENTSAVAGQDRREETAALIPAITFEADVTSSLELNLEYTAQVGIPDLSQTTHSGYAYMSLDLFRDVFELTSSLTWERVESPRASEDGVVPKRDDFKTKIGIGVDF